MNRGLVILIFLGVLLVAFFYMSPVAPDVESETSETSLSEEASDSASIISPEQQVDEALRQIQAGEVPPMQGILKIRAVAENYPGNVKANFTLGTLSMQTGQFDKAIGRFETVLETQPENAEVWKFLAEAQFRTGDSTTAKQSFEKALEFVDETTADAYKEEFNALKN